MIWGGEPQAGSRSRSRRRLRSPWSHGELAKVLGAEFIGLDAQGYISRSQAMSLPPVTKARAILAGQIAKAPLVELHETTDNAFTDDQIDDLIDDYLTARQDPNGIVTFTPYNVEMKVHGEQATNVAIEGRNFAKIDIANFMNLPGSALDGSLSTASLTYSTEGDKRNEIQDYSVDYWADPIAARFSQDDCVDEGVRVRFDFTQNRTTTPSPTGAATKD